jgi:hypothetical protein
VSGAVDGVANTEDGEQRLPPSCRPITLGNSSRVYVERRTCRESYCLNRKKAMILKTRLQGFSLTEVSIAKD